MSSSDEIQKNPGETSLSQASPPVQRTPETSTNPSTTNNNRNNSEVNNKKNNDDNSPATAENHTLKSSNNDNSNTAITNANNEHSRCPGFRHLFKKDRSPKANSKQGANSNLAEKDGSTKRKEDADKERKHSQHAKLKKKLEQIEKYIGELVSFKGSDGHEDMKNHLVRLKDIVEKSEKGIDNMDASSIAKTPAIKLPEVNKEIMELMKHLSSPETVSKKVSLSAHLQSSSSSNGRSAVHELANVHKNESFSKVSFYSEIRDIFCKLDEKKKFILSCFTVFPENAVVKRRTLLYWVVGEGFLVSSSTENENMSGKIGGKFRYVFQEKSLLNASGTEEEEEMPEKIVDGILKDFEEKGLIEPAIKKRKQPQHVKSYRMDPLVRSAVIKLSQDEKFFDYDSKGNVLPQRDWTSGLQSTANVLPQRDSTSEENVSFQRSQRLCLQNIVEQDEKKRSTEMEKQAKQVLEKDLENVITLFNVNEPFPDLELAWLTKMKDNPTQTKEPSALDWLSKMKNARVVCLGGWPGSGKYHIEVESTEFLNGLTSSKELRFLSLQGISRITELPNSIGKHSNLVILDLKECHNLQVIPEEIAQLTNLRYLDLSDCYLLARMPKGLYALSKLRVLKGFVISNSQKKRSGTLDDLKKLKKLRKLTINANSEKFPTPADLCALHELGEEGALKKLTIAWGAELAELADQNGKEGSCWKRLITARKQQESETMKDQLPEKLEKLDLQCFPKSKATWLTPESLPDLKELYIRGGNLATLGKSKWSEVKTLRLKYLRGLKMTWIELQEYFPQLEYLEKVKCPGITLCPCDQHGVWMKTI
ncbi:uncharacterized protein LOC115970223 [Quercus lobata]|uniref:Disease resistance R13L4/SHOC-2-like LRR domain-containing protein n=1 Tax=Quercus lobata TaxID=97700 RepID=A0A7N2N0Y9_QUELO|nr:uncharacterized protein LOC115970223 [Quercus lobata]